MARQLTNKTTKPITKRIKHTIEDAADLAILRSIDDLEAVMRLPGDATRAWSTLNDLYAAYGMCDAEIEARTLVFWRPCGMKRRSAREIEKQWSKFDAIYAECVHEERTLPAAQPYPHFGAVAA